MPQTFTRRLVAFLLGAHLVAPVLITPIAAARAQATAPASTQSATPAPATAPASVTTAGARTARPFPEAPPAQVGVAADRLARLGPALREYVTRGQLAGGVVLVARHGTLLHADAFGFRDREAQAPMRTDTIFRIASQTKALVSVGIMMLQEEGKLLLSDPLGKYLSEFQRTTVAVPNETGGYDVVDAKRPITLRDLLTQTAGIGYGMGIARDRWEAAGIQGWYFANRDEPIAATVSRMAALPFDAHPGERWVYGYATDILGVVIEKVSGEALDRFLRARVFEPLGMTDTHFYLPPEKRDRLAVVYSALPSVVHRDVGPLIAFRETAGVERAPEPGTGIGQGAYVDGPRASFSGGAGLLSTASDYARFLQMLLNGGTLDGTRLLSRKSVELMTAAHVPRQQYRDGQAFGLGFSVVEDVGARGTPGSVGEFGWGGAYHSTYWIDPKEGLVVVYMTQLIPAGGIDDYGKLRALIYQALDD
jgi:CubicO group peptidase (beta-lactamase class C family)